MKPYLKPGAIVITGTNPIEIYTYAYYKLLGVEKNKVIGFCAPDMIRMKWAIEEITGILNGTTNYILTKMDKEGDTF
mgnify:CR=1 FL=1